MTEKELLKLRDKVESAESSVQQLKGRRKELLAQLKADFKCDTNKEAKEKRKELISKLNTIQEKIETKLSDIETRWIEKLR
jgi:flagellar biosynthesis chaperone FliJ